MINEAPGACVSVNRCCVGDRGWQMGEAIFLGTRYVP